jgi:hypothetical protein
MCILPGATRSFETRISRNSTFGIDANYVRMMNLAELAVLVYPIQRLELFACRQTIVLFSVRSEGAWREHVKSSHTISCYSLDSGGFQLSSLRHFEMASRAKHESTAVLIPFATRELIDLIAGGRCSRPRYVGQSLTGASGRSWS